MVSPHDTLSCTYVKVSLAGEMTPYGWSSWLEPDPQALLSLGSLGP